MSKFGLSSFSNAKADYKRKFEIPLDRIPGDYSKPKDVDIIDNAKSLAVDNVMLNNDDEKSQSDEVDNRDDDSDDDDNNDEDDAVGGSTQDNLPRKDGNDGYNQDRPLIPQGLSHTPNSHSFDTDKESNKNSPSIHSSGKSMPAKSNGLGQSPSEAPHIRSF